MNTYHLPLSSLTMVAVEVFNMALIDGNLTPIKHSSGAVAVLVVAGKVVGGIGVAWWQRRPINNKGAINFGNDSNKVKLTM